MNAQERRALKLRAQAAIEELAVQVGTLRALVRAGSTAADATVEDCQTRLHEARVAVRALRPVVGP